MLFYMGCVKEIDGVAAKCKELMVFVVWFDSPPTIVADVVFNVFGHRLIQG